MKVFNKAGLQEKEIKFDVSLQNCPPSFVIDIKSNEMPYNTCYCSLRIYAGIYKLLLLRISSYKVLRGYWVGYDRGDRKF